MPDSGASNDLEFRIRRADLALAETSRRIAALTQAAGTFARNRRANKLPAPFTIGADSIAPLFMGFHEREHDRNDRPFRWTGKGNFFEFRLSLDRQHPWRFQMEMQPNDRVDIRALEAFVDYVRIPIDIGEGGGMVAGNIPGLFLSMRAVLTFHLPNTFSRAQPSDARALGLVFYEIRFEPIPDKELA